jgi:ATP-dependent Clp protease protease subunit
VKRFWNIVKNKETEEDEIRIDGDIGFSFWGWLFGEDQITGKTFREDLKQFKGKDIVVWINSDGGSVYDASQIYTALKEHKGKVTVKIDGRAISAASIIAMAGDEVLMSPTSVMMIHNPWTYQEGEVKDMQKAIDILTEIKETILNAYEAKTGMSREEISRLMDEETWMSAKKAKELGFADGVLYEAELPEDVQNKLVSGAKMVFASIKKPNLQDILKKFKEQEDSRQVPVDLYNKIISINERKERNYGLCKNVAGKA